MLPTYQSTKAWVTDHGHIPEKSDSPKWKQPLFQLHVGPQEPPPFFLDAFWQVLSCAALVHINTATVSSSVVSRRWLFTVLLSIISLSLEARIISRPYLCLCLRAHMAPFQHHEGKGFWIRHYQLLSKPFLPKVSCSTNLGRWWKYLEGDWQHDN